MRLRPVQELLDRRQTSCRRWREVRGQLELVAQRASAQSIRRSKADRVDPRSPLSTQHSALKYSSLRQLRTRRVWQYKVRGADHLSGKYCTLPAANVSQCSSPTLYHRSYPRRRPENMLAYVLLSRIQYPRSKIGGRGGSDRRFNNAVARMRCWRRIMRRRRRIVHKHRMRKLKCMSRSVIETQDDVLTELRPDTSPRVLALSL